jgi:hypothetical protein
MAWKERDPMVSGREGYPNANPDRSQKTGFGQDGFSGNWADKTGIGYPNGD